LVRCHNEVTNSSHEGTNYGIKWHSAPVLPGEPLQQSACTLKFQSDLKMNREARIAARAVEARPTHTNSSSYPTSEYLTELCHELVVEQWKLGSDYLVNKECDIQGQAQWYVVHSDKEGRQGMNHVLHPVWRRVRTVSQKQSGRLTCSCGHFERCGYPCRHQAAVIMLEDRTCRGFSHHDVAIMWWKKIAFFGMRQGNQQIQESSQEMIDECIKSLMRNDVDGPNLGIVSRDDTVQQVLVDTGPFEVKGPELSCLNFTKDQIRRATETFGGILSSAPSRGAPAGQVSECVGMMSQESHVSLGDIIPDNAGEMEIPLFPWMDAQHDSDDNSRSSMEDEDDHGLQTSMHGDEEPDNFLQELVVVDPSGPMSASKFVQQAKEEFQILEGLIYSKDFCPSFFDMQEYIQRMKETNSEVRAKMATAINHNQGQKWVSTNVARASSNKRQKGAEFGITKFR